MKLSQTPELLRFFSTYFSDSEPEQDLETVKNFMKGAQASSHEQLTLQLQNQLNDLELPLDELGSEANRWFSDDSEARQWLTQILSVLKSNTTSPGTQVKDSNGSQLLEGDSVQVIKDLKVKGGSSDLKRGTLIKKIHLVEDPEVVECRVDGSTLVLKTCFLKKA
jgi:hypothetical protein